MSDEPISTSAQHSRPRRWLIILAALFALAILAPFFVHRLIDFPVYYAAGRSLISGRTDLYSPDFALGRVMDYRYPPFFLVGFIPLWVLPYTIAAYIWYAISVPSIIGSVTIIARTFRVLGQSKKLWLVIALGVTQYFVMSLHYGNAHLLATFILFASIYFAVKDKDFVAGGLMALAITIKLTPILLMPYFALKKRWGLIASVCLWLFAINAAPSAYFGIHKNIELLGGWYTHVVASQEFHEDNGPINLSLKGQLRRYLSAVDYSQRVDGDVQYRSVNVASLSRERTDALWISIAAIVFGCVFWLIWWASRRPNSSRQEPGRDGHRREDIPLEIAVMICVMLFVGPLTSKIYFVALLWPVACLTGFATNKITRASRLAMYTLGLVALANSVLPLLPGRSVQRLLLVLGVDFYVNCLLTAALVYVLISRRRVPQAQFGEPQT